MEDAKIALDCQDEIIGREFDMAFCEQYDWPNCWPLVEQDADGRLMIVGIYDSSDYYDNPETILVDIQDGKIIRHGNDCANDAVMTRDEAERLGLVIDDDDDTED